LRVQAGSDLGTPLGPLLATLVERGALLVGERLDASVVAAARHLDALLLEAVSQRVARAVAEPRTPVTEDRTALLERGAQLGTLLLGERPSISAFARAIR
jgi:hypothetical protein